MGQTGTIIAWIVWGIFAALVVALDAGLPESVESAVSNAMTAVNGMHRAVTFLGAPVAHVNGPAVVVNAPAAATVATAPVSAPTPATGPVRFFTAIQPDSNSVADVYGTVAAL